MRTLNLQQDKIHNVGKALSSEGRVKILKTLDSGPKNINEISKITSMPFSTVSNHIKSLENAGLIYTEMLPGKGSQRVSYKKYDRIMINLESEEREKGQTILYDIDIGNYSSCEVRPTCGLLNEAGIIHSYDDPKSFYEPEHTTAQLLWFKQGFVKYQLPNRIPYGKKPNEISFTCEICSEAPNHSNDWPSDITCWINDIEIGKWTSPGDFGGEKGVLTPDWWEIEETQYGLLKKWSVNENGSFIDNIKISSITIEDLKMSNQPFISFKLGVKDTSEYIGGINIFGEKFGNYNQNIVMKITM